VATAFYGADISTHPKYRHEHIGKRLYDFRKETVIKFKLRRMISGRLFNYCDYANKMSALEYAQKAIAHELRDPRSFIRAGKRVQVYQSYA
jgi:hypothetical protein